MQFDALTQDKGNGVGWGGLKVTLSTLKFQK